MVKKEKKRFCKLLSKLEMYRKPWENIEEFKLGVRSETLMNFKGSKYSLLNLSSSNNKKPLLTSKSFTVPTLFIILY